MASVSLRGIEKRWGQVVGVARQSLDVGDGEFMVLLGPSGCGKTTTMRMIAGLEDPTEGEIWIGQRDVTDLLPRDRDIAMVFQNYGLYPHMTVAQNIGYPLKVRGQGRSERDAAVDAVARKVQLQPLLHRRPRELSGGQRQRVALARAIVRRPQVFLMDEPLSNLDAKLRVSMRAEIKHLQHELRITTIYVTHDQIEAMTLAHRVAVMDRGVIQQLDTPEAIYNRPANLFVAGFVGSPAMNLLPGTLENGDFVAPGLRIVGLGDGSRPDIVLGIRPEDLVICDPVTADAVLPVYSFELTGDSTLVTVARDEARITARGDRHLRHNIGEPVGLWFDRAHCHLFDATTQLRLVA
jgi:multiple sugar transport system ATP-binding protein